MNILLTGGAGYIGSHIAVDLLNKGHDVIIVDNFKNADVGVLCRIKQLTKKNFKLYILDILDYERFEKVFIENKIDAVIHLAGYKSVGESVKEPLKYYQNNVMGSVNVLKLMNKYNVNKIIFSSTATVYREDNTLPFTEESVLGTTNPYSTSKLIVERIIQDNYVSNKNFSSVILRYFNPIGAHPSGLIGESPSGIPNNLMPYIIKVANKEIDHLSIFGDDYPTKDGTGVRDYIHIMDLVEGHVLALDKLGENGVHTYNLGTGKGYSVLEVVNTFQRANNIKINYKIIDRRPGDMAEFYADSSKAYKELGWKAKHTLREMCKDAWKFGKIE
jgi:UDP-glucose 4-epimerase